VSEQHRVVGSLPALSARPLVRRAQVGEHAELRRLRRPQLRALQRPRDGAPVTCDHLDRVDDRRREERADAGCRRRHSGTHVGRVDERPRSVVNEHRIAACRYRREGAFDALTPGRAARHDDGMQTRRVVLRERRHRRRVLNLRRHDELGEFRHRTERRERPSDERAPGEFDQLLRLPEAHAAPRRHDDGREGHGVTLGARLSLAKIMRPAAVCSTLVT
jgi:hypothetical protein